MSYKAYQFKTERKGGVLLSGYEDALIGLLRRYGEKLLWVKLRGNVIYESNNENRS